jgi:peptide-methionine (S)-S-oxide reductase
MATRRFTWIAAAFLLTAAVAATLMLHAVAVGGDAVTSRTDYGRRHTTARTETATFAAGCFWKLEHAMRRIDGVVSTTAGYTGGDATNPAHAAVSSGRTGHTEAVRVEFDPAVVSYDRLLEAFWNSHDPTRFAHSEGEPPSPGRSIIFFHSDEQRAAAAASKRRLESSGKYAAVPTEILSATRFFPAESEHQQYLEKPGRGATCSAR